MLYDTILDVIGNTPIVRINRLNKNDLTSDEQKIKQFVNDVKLVKGDDYL